MSNSVADSPGNNDMAVPGGGSALNARLIEALAGMFPASSSDDLADIAARMDLVRLRRDEFLFRQGDPGDSLYILITGRVQVIGGSGSQDSQDRGGGTVLNELASGQSIGEMALITGEPRTADVMAIRDSHLARLSRQAFEALVGRYPEVLLAIARTVIGWLRQADKELAATGRRRRTWQCHTIAVVAYQPAGSTGFQPVAPAVDLSGFSNRLSAALAECGSTLHVTRDRLAHLAERIPADSLWTHLAAWLDQQESTRQFVLLEGSSAHAPWTGFCLRQADVVLVVVPWRGMGILPMSKTPGSPGPWDTGRMPVPPCDCPAAETLDPSAGPAVRFVSAGPARWVVFLHPDGSTLPSGTAAAVKTLADALIPSLGSSIANPQEHVAQPPSAVNGRKAAGFPADGGDTAEGGCATQNTGVPHSSSAVVPRPEPAPPTFAAHSHVRQDRDADFQRLARRVTGRAIGLALGGGGARGLAHIGVLAALAEADIPIDWIAGTSMGAIIGAMHGLGLDRSAMVQLSKKVWLEVKPFSRFTLPWVSLFGAAKFKQIARMVCGRTHIEDLWLDYLCVSTNLTTAEPMIHRRGLLSTAVQASASLPGAVPPVLHDGHLLADGGLLNNVPGDILRDLGCQRVIVVDVSAESRLTTTCQEIPNPWRMLLSRLGLADRPDIPSILDILYGATVVSSKGRARAVCRDADVCLQPPVKGFRTLQFEAIDEIVRIGYEYTHGRIEQIRTALGLGKESSKPR